MWNISPELSKINLFYTSWNISYRGLNPRWIQCKNQPEIAIRETKIYYRPISAITEWRTLLFSAIGVFILAVSIAYGCITAASFLHEELLANVMKNPMSFFDTTPLGRIINRFSKDVDTLDADLRYEGYILPTTCYFKYLKRTHRRNIIITVILGVI